MCRPGEALGLGNPCGYQAYSLCCEPKKLLRGRGVEGLGSKELPVGLDQPLSSDLVFRADDDEHRKYRTFISQLVIIATQ